MRNSSNSHHYSNSQSHSFLFFTIGVVSFVILLLIMAIIGRFAGAPAAATSESGIPDEAIRIRIIAHSNSDKDQSLKYLVRDEVSAMISSWGATPSTYDQAHKQLEERLSELQNHVNATLSEAGSSYGGIVELGKVSFPEKLFEGSTYEAGDYEALRITLGQGVGLNWWCVLFPPLCLTAATASDEVPAGEQAHPNSNSHSEPEPKFFLWEMLKKLMAFLKALFS